MPLYEYDSEGFFMCEHEDATRPNSTTKPNCVTPLEDGRFVDGQWSCDRSRQEARQHAADLAQLRLDSYAVALGYDNMLSLVSYRDSNVPKYRAEALAAAAWRDAVWSYAESSTATNIDNFLANLPPVP